MSTITFILACECGDEIQCKAEDQRIGSVYRCRACNTVWGHVTPKRGGRAWVRISEEDVRFHRLLDLPEDDEE